MIKIDLARPFSHVRVLQMSFERDQRSTMWRERVAVFSDAASESAHSAGCINRDRGEVLSVTPVVFHDNAAKFLPKYA